MLFQAVVKVFVRLNYVKVQSKMQIDHWSDTRNCVLLRQVTKDDVLGET